MVIAEVKEEKSRGVEGTRARLARSAILVVLLLATALLLLKPMIELPERVAKDWNEGWNAYHADRALASKKLYPGHAELISLNYTPLSFYVVGAIGSVIGDNIIAGRLVALLSLVSVAVLAAVTIRLVGGSWFGSFLGAVLLLGYMAARHSLYVAMNDPQWFGHAIMMAGAALFVYSRQKGPLFYGSAFTMVLAGFAKHTLIPFPLAATIWLALYDRPALRRWLVVSSLAVVTGLALATILYGEDFWHGIFLENRQYSRGDIAAKIDVWFTPALPLIVLGLIAVPLLRRVKLGVLILLYIAISGLLCVVLWGGKDVGGNAVFDFLIGLTIATGLLLGDARAAGTTTADSTKDWRGLLVLVPLIALAPVLLKNFYDARWAIKGLPLTREIVREDVDFIAARNGPVMCENLALCYWAGKDFEVDLFNTGQKIRMGIIEERKLTDLFEQDYFAAIQLDGQDGSSFRLPESVLKKIHDRYELARVSSKSGSILVPRRK